MDYFINDINQLEADVNKNYGFDYDIEELIYTDFEEYFHVPNNEVFYTIIDQDHMELARDLESSASSWLILTDTMSLLIVDEVKFLFFDFVDICILLVDKAKKEDLNNLLNSLL